jgi:hypothetical protein
MHTKNPIAAGALPAADSGGISSASASSVPLAGDPPCTTAVGSAAAAGTYNFDENRLQQQTD